GERDEAAVRQLARKSLIDPPVLLADDILWPPLQSMLAHHHRPLLARLQVFWQTQNPIRKYIGKHVEHHFIARPLRRLIALAAPRLWLQQRLIKAPNHLRREILAILLRRRL